MPGPLGESEGQKNGPEGPEGRQIRQNCIRLSRKARTSSSVSSRRISRSSIMKAIISVSQKAPPRWQGWTKHGISCREMQEALGAAQAPAPIHIAAALRSAGLRPPGQPQSPCRAISIRPGWPAAAPSSRQGAALVHSPSFRALEKPLAFSTRLCHYPIAAFIAALYTNLQRN